MIEKQLYGTSQACKQQAYHWTLLAKAAALGAPHSESGTAPTQTAMRRSINLPPRRVHTASSPSQELWTVLGPVTFVPEADAEKTLKEEPVGPSAVRAGMFPDHPKCGILVAQTKDSPLNGLLSIGLSTTDPMGMNHVG